jgi:adenylate cyclase
LYRGVVVLPADLCSFSSYVRDSPYARVVRESLTSFYSKSRYQIFNSRGTLYQFVRDEVIELFGLPDREAETPQTASEAANRC